jgi:hypothetical protein
MTPVRKAFLKGFAIGVGLVAVSNGSQLVTGSLSVPSNVGGWVDLAVEALLGGL